MPSTPIEFDLSAEQFERMGYPQLTQGQPLSVILDAGVLLPDVRAEAWFAVQPEPLPPRFTQVWRAAYAFSGQIQAADIVKEAGENGAGEQTATLVVECDGVPLRVTCAPQADGRLPYGTWETRWLTGLGRLSGIVEDDFSSPIGESVGVTAWNFRRLVLTPGDPKFGEWHESSELLSTPFRYDRVVVEARLHRRSV